MRRNGRRRNHRGMAEGELDLLPMMNVFIVLIPMLLSSAVFLKVTVIDTNVPSASAAPSAVTESLSLAITIKDDFFVVEGRGIESRAIARKDADAATQLAAALADVVIAHPGQQDVIIISEPKTRYQDIVAVMDISRASGLQGASLLGAE